MTSEVSGHFGEWFQGIEPSTGDLVAVSVPCQTLRARATRLSVGALTLDGDARAASRDQVARLFDALGLEPGAFQLQLGMPPGGGAGASTASLVALARAAGYEGSDLACACVEIEGASDPLMFEAQDTLLWSPRRGKVIERLEPPPTVEIVGGFWGDPIKTDPADFNFPEIGDLIDRWRDVRTPKEAARVASISAERTTALRGPDGDPTPIIVSQIGALGWLRAHTGSARGLIFPPGAVPENAEAHLLEAGYSGILRFQTGGEV